MKKIKLLIASMLGAIALVFACVLGTKVNAATENFTVDDSISSTTSIAAGTKIYDGISFTVTTGGKAVTKTACGAGTVYLNTDTEQKGISFTNGLNSSDNGVTYTVFANSDANITFYYTACDKGSSFGASTVSTKGAKLQVDGTATTSSNVTHSSNLAYSYNVDISKGSSKTFSLSGGKFVLFGVSSSYTESTATITGITATSTVDYEIGDTFDATKISVTATYNDSTSSLLSSSKYDVSIENDITTFTTADTYTVTVTLKEDTTISTTFDIIIPNNILYKFYNSTHTDNDDYEVASGITIIKAKKGTGRTNTFGSDTIENYMQGSEIDFTLNGKAEVSFYVTQTSAETNVNVRSYYIKDNSGNIIFGTGYTPVYKPSKSGDSVSNYQTIVLPAGTYKLISPIAVLNFYGMRINYETSEDAISKTNFVNFEWQFDNENDPDKVRFIGTLNNTDITKLSDMSVSLYLRTTEKNNYNAKLGTISFTKVYTAVKNGEDYLKTANDGTYYTICTLTNTKALVEKLGTDVISGKTWVIEAKLNYTYDGVQYIVPASELIALN